MQNVLKICFKRPGITMKGSKRNTPVDLFFAFHEIYKSRIKKNRKMCFHVMEILFRILAATVSAVGKSNLSPGTSLNWAKVILIEIKDKDKVACLQYIYWRFWYHCIISVSCG